MRPLSRDAVSALLAARGGPCVSIYQPPQGAHPDTQQGPARFRNLVRQAEDALRQTDPAAARELADKLGPLADDTTFWGQRRASLAAFAAPDFLSVLDLSRPVKEQVVVADHFHIKPLLRMLQTAEHYQVLCLTRTHARMLQGTRDALEPIDLHGVPGKVEEAVGSGVRVQLAHQTHGGKTFGERMPIPASSAGVMEGHPAKGDDAKMEAQRYFRAVDKAVWEHHSRETGLPLILAALPENQSEFRGLSHNQHLLPQGIEGNPDAMSLDQLREAAWKVVEPHHHARTREVIDLYQASKARGLGTDSLAEAGKAARAGRVGTLLIDADRQFPGALDAQTGEPRPASDDTADDMLDELGEVVLRMKGTVFVLPGAIMPTQTGLAAIYRY